MALVVLVPLLVPSEVSAQDERAARFLPASTRSALVFPAWHPTPSRESRPREDGGTPAKDEADKKTGAGRVAMFLAGGAAALGLHESGHLMFDAVFGVRPVLRRVDFGGIPFFAISHQSGLPPRREFAIASAGFWMQHLSSELILSRHPHLSREPSPLRKGMLAFNVIASIAYASAAMAHAGPTERDTRAMADSLRVDERWVGALVLTPALLDAWRYWQPGSRVAAWLSRGVKIGAVVLTARARP